ncbi:hypothetical protein BJ138DRAFT_1183534 [Hygrophoropsis aurantiaca]|uniref:Uncharacterized protein n=1 Tax=Hygrophoropsis aurantiaca TaxID=72124 RepID=A0ACB7ZZ91_9AGAM|nr:hypothetical protein BJ138DRAFT_1183534 [Hygrophoropsis aurantiaca]
MKVPVEVWLQIAEHLTSVDSLLNFGLASGVLQQAAETVVECPCVDNWRLLAVVQPQHKGDLQSTEFLAVRGDNYTQLRVSWHHENTNQRYLTLVQNNKNRRNRHGAW